MNETERHPSPSTFALGCTDFHHLLHSDQGVEKGSSVQASNKQSCLNEPSFFPDLPARADPYLVVCRLQRVAPCEMAVSFVNESVRLES